MFAPLFPFIPDRAPSNPKPITQGIEPSAVSQVKRQNGIFASPAGSEMKARTSGITRQTSTVRSPCFWNQPSTRASRAGLTWISLLRSIRSMRP